MGLEIPKRKVAIVGAGMMGSGIAACASISGHATILVDLNDAMARNGLEQTIRHIDQLLKHELAGEDEALRARELLRTTTKLGEAVEGAFLVIESVPERLPLKQMVFRKLDALAPPDVMITSNTSGLRITEIARDTKYPKRMATTHFWFPGHLVPLVEIVMGEETDEAVAMALHRLLKDWGKAPVIVRKDVPGQLANRILQAVIREAVNIVEVGLATPEDVDTAIKMGMGIRLPVWGPLEHIDAVGLDLGISVQESVLPSLCNETKPSKYLQDLVDKGALGHKSGRGFYDWQIRDMEKLSALRDRFIIEARKVIEQF
jgi:3-hydroxybutyryl-CoA dehydrogenase